MLSFASIAHAAQGAQEAVDRVRDAAAAGTDEFVARMRSDPFTWIHLIGAAAALAVLAVGGALRPGSLKGGRDVTAHAWIIWLACGIMVLVASWIGGGVVASLVGLSSTPGSLSGLSVREQALVGLCGYSLAIGTALVLRRLLATSAPQAGLQLRPQDLPLAAFAAVLTWPIVQAASILCSWIVVAVGGNTPERIAHSTLQTMIDERSNPWTWVLAGLAVIAAPVVEEFVFRAGLQSSLLRLFGRPWLAILATSTGFALIHMGDPRTAQWTSMVVLAALGVCLGFAYERTRSLIVPIVIHAGFNAANVAIALGTNH